MKALKDILYRVRLSRVSGDTSLPVDHVTFDSREVKKGSLFVAIPGTQVDGHRFIGDAIEKGAGAIICESIPEDAEGPVMIQVSDARAALGQVASNFYGEPSGRLTMVGVTGTNGKTTVATLLHHLFMELGHPSGLLSTITDRIGREAVPSELTTPDPLTLHARLAEMVEAGCGYCFMEVSSHALVQERVKGIEFDIAVFTNISREHLDYHPTFQDYLEAKRKLFDELSPDSYALVNRDDRHADQMTQNTRATTKSFALHTMADFQGKVLECDLRGLRMTIDGNELISPIIGRFNASNMLAVYASAVLTGEEPLEVLQALSKVKAVDGRFQTIRSEEGVTGIVDYAHPPDALENVLGTIEELRTRNERLITVVGCGGDRDRSKRPVMARSAVKYSDRVIFTSDNPRSEDPMAIIEEMKEGVGPTERKRVLSIPDRREAINTASGLAESGDIVLVAGKGHEKTQEVNGEKRHFDDLEELRDALGIKDKESE
jgi:UDP-N-acetylmuramoyl-L-alanyl-D-glutamate--2,6-diaminopimelate ligase